MNDPVWSKIVHIEVHTQLHSATLVSIEIQLFKIKDLLFPLNTLTLMFVTQI